MQILWGEPNNPGEMNFKTETLLNKSKAASTDYWTVHPMRKWYGVTVGDNIFIGVILFAPRKSRRTPAKERA